MSTTVPTATDEDVFRAFSAGDGLEGDTTSSTTRDGHAALLSHGVLLALRSEECVVFDARPCHDGERCLCRYMVDITRARRLVREVFAEDEVYTLDHGAFVDLARRLGLGSNGS